MDLLRKAFDVSFAGVGLLDRPGGYATQDAVGNAALFRLPPEEGRLVLIEDAAHDARFDGARVEPGGSPVRFFAGVPLEMEDGACIGALCLLDGRPRRWNRDESGLLVRMAGVATALLRQGRTVPPNPDPPREAEGAAPSMRYKKMYDRCSALARIGVWECDLSTEAVTWTDGVYDLFDLPHGVPTSRALAKAFYDEPSRREMERMRSRAIAERSGFTLDVRITTAKGRLRWIRLSADVECEEGVPVRIFGLKQDITQEKELLDRLQHMAERDPLTGVANRGVFEARLAQADRRLPEDQPLAAVVLVDVDRFKQVNDTLGHAAGDRCLRQVAEDLIRSFAPSSLAARLGGDEFAVLLYGAATPAEVTRDIGRLVARSRRTVVRGARSLEVSISVGVAFADGARGSGEAERLVHRADLALYAAKDAGRDGFRTFPVGIGDTVEEEDPQGLGRHRAVA